MSSYYFEMVEKNDVALNILAKYMGEVKAQKIIRLAHSYELELTIQCIPDVVLLFCINNIAVYQVVRCAKTGDTWV